MKESNEELRREHLCFFCVLSKKIKIMQSKQRQILSYYYSSLVDQNKKNAKLEWQETDNADTGRGWQTWVTRWREQCTSLDVSDRKQAKLLLGT